MSKFKIYFFVVAILMCIIEFANITWLRFYIKPLICPILIIYIFQNSVDPKSLSLIILSLIFACLGDTLLMWEQLFIIGLIAFLIAHIFYIIEFFKHIEYQKLAKPRYLLFTGIILAIVFIFYNLISGNLNDLKLPVIVYMAIISIMLILAVLSKNSVGYMQVLIGAILFMVSDSTLAYAKFTQNFMYSSVVVIITYMLAQYCIINGCIKRGTING